MPRIAYIDKTFRAATLELIDQANQIVREYREAGFSLTLRQLYYLMVARDLIPNSLQQYKRLGSTINNARLAGLIDWSAIEDRTRTLRGNSHWSSPHSILQAATRSYREDTWADQPHRVEVWIEKDALVGVISGICEELDIDYFSCRGYTSASAMWRAGLRLSGYIEQNQLPVILHFGDHDPSGIDMTRDIQDRLSTFAEFDVQVERVALNQDQIELYSPPPNFAKLTDSRINGYVALHGHDSWELDALDPHTIVDLIEEEVVALRDDERWEAAVAQQETGRARLAELTATLAE